MKNSLVLLCFLLCYNLTFSQNNSIKEPFTFVEVMPEYIGGEEALYRFISDSIDYPNDNNIEGTVLVEFIINEDGSLSDFEVLQGINKEVDQKAIDVLKKSGNWKPGKQNGELVKVIYAIPILFSKK